MSRVVRLAADGAKTSGVFLPLQFALIDPIAWPDGGELEGNTTLTSYLGETSAAPLEMLLHPAANVVCPADVVLGRVLL